MTIDQTRVRKGRKFDQVLAGARDVFMADGFEGASVDAIARAAGVSKATLYSYFPDKRLLFMEVADTECARQSRQAFESIDTDAPPRVVLGLAGRHLLGFITSTFGHQMFRLCVAECDRFPSLASDFTTPAQLWCGARWRGISRPPSPVGSCVWRTRYWRPTNSESSARGMSG